MWTEGPGTPEGGEDRKEREGMSRDLEKRGCEDSSSRQRTNGMCGAEAGLHRSGKEWESLC